MNEAFGKKLCLDNLQRNEDQPYNLGQYPCHPKMAMSQVNLLLTSPIVKNCVNQRKTFMQVFALSKQGHLRREESCAEVQDIVAAESPVKMVTCAHEPRENQKWVLTEVIK